VKLQLNIVKLTEILLTFNNKFRSFEEFENSVISTVVRYFNGNSPAKGCRKILLKQRNFLWKQQWPQDIWIGWR